MANTYGWTHSQAHARLWGNNQGTPQRTKARNTVNESTNPGQDGGGKENTHRKLGQDITIQANQNHQALLCANRRPIGGNTHEPNRSLPIYIRKRKRVNHGCHPSQCKLRICWTNEEPNRSGTLTSIPDNSQQNEDCQTGDKDAPIRQWSVPGIQGCHSKQRNEIQVGTTRKPQAESGGKGDSSLQSALHCNIGRRWQQVPTITMVLSPGANRTHTQPTTPIQNCPQNLSMCSCARAPWLNEETMSTIGMRTPCACQTRGPPHVGHTIRSRVQPGHIHGAPPMF